MTALESTVTLPVALATIWPPLVPAVVPVAVTSPSISTEPPMPCARIVPVLLPTLLAAIVPPALTRVRISPSAAEAVSTTVPPFAMIVPVLVTSAGTVWPFSRIFVTWLVTFRASRPSP